MGIYNFTTFPSYSHEVDASSQFRYSPEFSASVSYQVPRIGTNISMFYKFTGERAEYFEGLDKQDNEVYYLRTMPSYNFADITVSQKITSFLRLNLGVKNLFDVTSLQTTSDRNDVGIMPVSYLGCGRSWFAGLTFDMDGKF